MGEGGVGKAGRGQGGGGEGRPPPLLPTGGSNSLKLVGWSGFLGEGRQGWERPARHPRTTAPGWRQSEQAERKPRQAGTEQLQGLAPVPASSLPEGTSRKRLPEQLPAGLCFWLTSVPLDSIVRSDKVGGAVLPPRGTGEIMPLPQVLCTITLGPGRSRSRWQCCSGDGVCMRTPSPLGDQGCPPSIPGGCGLLPEVPDPTSFLWLLETSPHGFHDTGETQPHACQCLPSHSFCLLSSS